MSNISQFRSGLLKFNTGQLIGTLTDSSEQSAAFQSDTVAIAIGSVGMASPSCGVHFTIGSNPTATTGDVLMPHVSASDSFSDKTPTGGYLIIGVNAGDKIACLRAAGNSVKASVIELKY